MQQELISPRLRLRPLAAGDVDTFHKCLTHPEVRRYLLDDKILARDQVAEIIAASAASFASAGFGFYGLELRTAARELIGFCGHRSAEYGEGLELLFGLFPCYWGKGLGSEAARAVLDDVFLRHRIERVLAATDTPNQRSVRVLQRLGMTFECRREFKGLDTVFYSLCREEYLLSCTSAS